MVVALPAYWRVLPVLRSLGAGAALAAAAAAAALRAIAAPWRMRSRSTVAVFVRRPLCAG